MKRLLSILFLTVSVASVAFAQDGKTTISSVSPDVAEEIGNMSDPGGTQSPLLSHFRASVQTRAQYVTNARLSGNHSSSELLFLPTFEGGFSAPLGGGFSVDLVARAESIIYSRYSGQNLWGFSGAATLNYTPRPGWPTLWAGVEPFHYQNFDASESLAEAVGLVAGIDHHLTFNRDRSMLFFGYKFGSYHASPSLDDRDVHRGLVGIGHQIRPNLIGQLFYSYQFSHYGKQDRDDHRNILGATLIQQFSQNLFGSVACSLIDNDSNESLASYQNFAVSAGLALQF